MGIVEEVQATVERGEESVGKRETTRRLEDFYEEYKRKGLVQPKGYRLPLPDTIGHSVPPQPRTGG